MGEETARHESEDMVWDGTIVISDCRDVTPGHLLCGDSIPYGEAHDERRNEMVYAVSAHGYTRDASTGIPSVHRLQYTMDTTIYWKYFFLFSVRFFNAYPKIAG